MHFCHFYRQGVSKGFKRMFAHTVWPVKCPRLDTGIVDFASSTANTLSIELIRIDTKSNRTRTALRFREFEKLMRFLISENSTFDIAACEGNGLIIRLTHVHPNNRKKIL